MDSVNRGVNDHVCSSPAVRFNRENVASERAVLGIKFQHLLPVHVSSDLTSLRIGFHFCPMWMFISISEDPFCVRPLSGGPSTSTVSGSRWK